MKGIGILIDLYRKHRTFILYSVIGASGASLDFLVYSLLATVFGVNYIVANCISIFLGISNNFFLNAKFNFRVTDKVFSRYLRFLCVGLLGLLMSSFLLYVLVDNLKMNVVMAKLLTIAFIVVVQFFLNRLVTFSVRKS